MRGVLADGRICEVDASDVRGYSLSEALRRLDMEETRLVEEKWKPIRAERRRKAEAEAEAGGQCAETRLESLYLENPISPFALWSPDPHHASNTPLTHVDCRPSPHPIHQWSGQCWRKTAHQHKRCVGSSCRAVVFVKRSGRARSSESSKSSTKVSTTSSLLSVSQRLNRNRIL